MNQPKTTRIEHEIFAELAMLCVKPGYVHVIAYFCFRDNIITYDGKMTEADMQQMFDPSRLIRTEITTLTGLMVKAKIDWQIPHPDILQSYIDKSERLLSELHDCMIASSFRYTPGEEQTNQSRNPFNAGTAMREPIFYGSESAYIFQYYDLAARKYCADASWLLENYGFTIDDACTVMRAVERLQEDRVVESRQRLAKLHPDDWTMLPCFTFTASEIAAHACLSSELTKRILAAFTLPVADRNEMFGALQDFNAVSATPLLHMPDGQFLLLQSYALAEALYEAPFYWMMRDKNYQKILAENRGYFTESFVAERLSLVFGRDRVFINVNVWESKARKVGEIDVLVIWGDRAIVVQAKSKRLTLEARKGNDLCIRDDFKKSIQDSYDQGVLCAQSLGDKHRVLITAKGCNVTLPNDLHEIYLFCVVSDHYPARFDNDGSYYQRN
ncbi:MAG: NERD domain-containing protein [Magnetococcus sp. YQC-5]